MASSTCLHFAKKALICNVAVQQSPASDRAPLHFCSIFNGFTKLQATVRSTKTQTETNTKLRLLNVWMEDFEIDFYLREGENKHPGPLLSSTRYKLMRRDEMGEGEGGG